MSPQIKPANHFENSKIATTHIWNKANIFSTKGLFPTNMLFQIRITFAWIRQWEKDEIKCSEIVIHMIPKYIKLFQSHLSLNKYKLKQWDIFSLVISYQWGYERMALICSMRECKSGLNFWRIVLPNLNLANVQVFDPLIPIPEIYY